VCSLYSNKLSKTAIWKSSHSIAAPDITSRFQKLTVATDRQVVTCQRHWLSVPLCPRYSKMHTRRTPRVPAATYFVQTGPSRADRSWKAQVCFSGLQYITINAWSWPLSVKNVCGKHVSVSVTGWWTGISFFVRLAALTTERVLRPFPWCICTLRVAILYSFNCRRYMGT